MYSGPFVKTSPNFSIPDEMKAWVLGDPGELKLTHKPVPVPKRAEAAQYSSSQQVIPKSRPGLTKCVPTPDEIKSALHALLGTDIARLSDTDLQFFKQVSHDTLLKDLKVLGIRSQRRQKQNRENGHSNNHLRRAMFLLIHYRLRTHLVQAEEAGGKLTNEERF